MKPAKKMLVMGGNKFKLPYTLDFSTLPDGAAIGKLTGSTWSVAAGKAINTPTEGAELLTNGNMETGDPVSNWTPTQAGSSIASVADERTGGAGSKAGEVTSGAAFGSVRQQMTVAKGKFLVHSGWFKKGTSTSGQITLGGVGFSSLPAPTDAAWTNYIFNSYVNTANPFNGIGCTTNAATSRYDDISAKEISGVFAGMQTTSALQTVKATTTLTLPYSRAVGVFMCGNHATAPTSLVLATIAFYTPTFVMCKLWKIVNTTLTELASANIAHVAGAQLEIRRTAATTFQLWYNGTQRGTDQTISDAEIVSNTYAGIFSTGGSGNSIGAFFLL